MSNEKKPFTKFDGLVLIFLFVVFFPLGIVYLIFRMWRLGYFSHSSSTVKPISSSNDSGKIQMTEKTKPKKDDTASNYVTIDEFECDVYSTHRENTDGSSRQKYLSECAVGEKVDLRIAPTEDYPELMGVFVKDGRYQIGDMPFPVINRIKKDYLKDRYEAVVSNIWQGSCLRCSLKFTIYRDSKLIKNGVGYLNTTCEEIDLHTKTAIKNFRKENSYIVVDVETTGLSPLDHEIIEIAMLKYASGVEVDRYTTFVKPSEDISNEVTALTGITNDDVKNAPSIKDISEQITAFIGNSVLVAHNASFDVGFLRTAVAPKEFHFKYIDTLALSRHTLKGTVENHKLGTLAKHYNLNLENAHRSTDDAACTNALFIKLCDELLARTYAKKEDN